MCTRTHTRNQTKMHTQRPTTRTARPFEQNNTKENPTKLERDPSMRIRTEVLSLRKPFLSFISATISRGANEKPDKTIRSSFLPSLLPSFLPSLLPTSPIPSLSASVLFHLHPIPSFLPSSQSHDQSSLSLCLSPSVSLSLCLSGLFSASVSDSADARKELTRSSTNSTDPRAQPPPLASNASSLPTQTKQKKKAHAM